jgi:hypothetical protein
MLINIMSAKSILFYFIFGLSSRQTKKTQKDKQQPATLHRNYRLSNKNPAKKLSETKSYTNDTSVDVTQVYQCDWLTNKTAIKTIAQNNHMFKNRKP